MKRIVHLKQLPDGRALLHWFVHDPAGPIQTLARYETIGAPIGVLQLGGARGRICCNPTQNCTRLVKGNEVWLCRYTDEPGAATCPKCLATEEWREAMKPKTEKKVSETEEVIVK